MFVIDSMLEDKTQDIIVLLCIIDSVMGRIRMELPQREEVWIVTNNALRDQKDVVKMVTVLI